MRTASPLCSTAAFLRVRLQRAFRLRFLPRFLALALACRRVDLRRAVLRRAVRQRRARLCCLAFFLAAVAFDDLRLAFFILAFLQRARALRPLLFLLFLRAALQRLRAAAFFFSTTAVRPGRTRSISFWSPPGWRCPPMPISVPPLKWSTRPSGSPAFGSWRSIPLPLPPVP